MRTADDTCRPTTRESKIHISRSLTPLAVTIKNCGAPTQRLEVRVPTPLLEAESRVRTEWTTPRCARAHSHPPARCSGERARRPAGQVQANLGGARTHPRAGAQGRVLAAQGVRPQKASAARSLATATSHHRALHRWSCSRARRRHSRRTSSNCTVQPSAGSPGRMRSYRS